jgi:hypothetical protein
MTNVIDFPKRDTGFEIEGEMARCPQFLSQMLEEEGFEKYPDYVWIAATQMVDGKDEGFPVRNCGKYSISDGDNGEVVLYRKLQSLGKVIRLSVRVEDIKDAQWLDVFAGGRYE